MRRRSTIITSIEHADGTAVIVRERGKFLLSGYSDSGRCRLEDHVPTIYGLAGDQTAVGGLLPPGAVDAEIVDRAGGRHRPVVADGAWLAVIDELATRDLPPVRYMDAEAQTVRQPLPTQWRRSPLADAREPCPACAAVSWDEVIPSRGERGRRVNLSGGWEPMPIVVCRDCGHDRAAGSNASEFGHFPWLEQKRASRGALNRLRCAGRRLRRRRGIG